MTVRNGKALKLGIYQLQGRAYLAIFAFVLLLISCRVVVNIAVFVAVLPFLKIVRFRAGVFRTSLLASTFRTSLFRLTVMLFVTTSATLRFLM